MMAETGRGRERGRKQERDGRRRPQPRQHTDQGSDEDADEAVEEIDRLQRDLEAAENALENLHAQNPKGPVGSWVFSQSWNST